MAVTEIRSSRPATDRRIQRTRTALIDAFRDLVLKQGYDAITPTRLAAAANVGRSTFYEHFASVDEVLGVSMGGLFGPMVGWSLAPDMAPGMVEIVQHFWENRKIGRAMLAGGARPVVLSILSERFEAGLADLQTPAAGSPKLAAAYLAAGTLAVLETWLAGRASGSAVQVATALHAAGHAAARAFSTGPAIKRSAG